MRSLGRLLLLTALAPAFVAPPRPPSGALAGAARVPRATLRAWHPAWAWSQHISIWKKIGDNPLGALGLLLSIVSLVFQRKESRRGKINALVKSMKKPYAPQLPQDQVLQRGIMDDLRRRIKIWTQHATVITGRFGCGKTVALQEALRGMQGIIFWSVRSDKWEEALYKSLRMDDHQMLKDALSKAKEQGLTPIIVLDIPRKANEGGKDFPFPLFFVGVTSIMDSVSTFAKDVSSDSSLAHAPRRRFSFSFHFFN